MTLLQINCKDVPQGRVIIYVNLIPVAATVNRYKTRDRLFKRETFYYHQLRKVCVLNAGV